MSTAETPSGSPRSGTVFVVLTLVFLAVLVLFLLVVSPRLQARLGLRGEQAFPTPDEVHEVPLRLGGEQVGQAIWDADGICAEFHDTAGTTFRTCATPDPLKPIWAIDAPDEASEGLLVIGTAKDVARIEGSTRDGEVLHALTQARELRAAWAVIPLPDGAVVRELIAYNSEDVELGRATCGGEDAHDNGPRRLGGGCVVPRED